MLIHGFPFWVMGVEWGEGEENEEMQLLWEDIGHCTRHALWCTYNRMLTLCLSLSLVGYRNFIVRVSKCTSCVFISTGHLQLFVQPPWHVYKLFFREDFWTFNSSLWHLKIFYLRLVNIMYVVQTWALFISECEMSNRKVLEALLKSELVFSSLFLTLG